jgi:hypothetical protein
VGYHGRELLMEPLMDPQLAKPLARLNANTSMTPMPLRIRAQCMQAAKDYVSRLRDIVRECTEEERRIIPEPVPGDIDRLFELHDVAVRIAALRVKRGA